MPNACFDGDFRQRPNQNFSGTSRNLHRDQLLQHAALERKQREESRQHGQLATRLQSHVRRYLVRKRWLESLRSDFDAISNSLQPSDSHLTDELLHSIVKKFVIFYSPNTDTEKLYFLIQLLINNVHLVRNSQLTSLQWSLWLKNVFKYTSLLLKSLPEENFSFLDKIQLILQFFNLYLDSAQFDSGFVQTIWLHLISNGHFKNVLDFFDKYWNLLAHNMNSFESIYEQLILVPLSLPNFPENHSRVVAKNFLLHFLSKNLNHHTNVIILPRLESNLPVNINVSNLISAFAELDAQDPYSFLWIFYSSLKLLSNNIQQISNEQLVKYFQIIRMFTFNLSSYLKSVNFKFNFKSSIDNDDDDDDELDCESQKSDENQKLYEFVEEIFAILNNASHCSVIVKYMDNILTKDKESLVSLCYLCHMMLLFHPFAIHKNRLLHSLAFNSNFLKDMWQYLLSESCTSLMNGPITYINVLIQGMHSMFNECEVFLPPLTLFCALFNYFLQTLDDVEFFNEYLMNDIENNLNNPYNYSVLPFKLTEIVSMSSKLRDICISLIELAYQDTSKLVMSNSYLSASTYALFQHEYSIVCWNLLLQNSLKLVRHIHARDIRRQFCPENHWISKKLFSIVLPANFNQALKQRGQLYQEFRGIRHLSRVEMETFGSPIPVKDIINVTIIQELPFVMPFHHRVKVMQTIISFEKRNHENDFYELLPHMNAIIIRRNYLYEDAFEKFSPESIPDLRKVIRIQLISSLGTEETGIDGGGVFREFLAEALKTAFDPNRGFFKTTSNGLLYPNPAVHLLHPNSDKHFYFIGRLLGKAIFENMLIELPLAPFFLAKLLINNINSDVEINHLASLDPFLYKSLISLKNYQGDVADLGLDFSIVNSEFGTTVIEELKPNGTNTPVTNQNRIEYIHLMADYKLNKQIRKQCAAFKQGFYNVVKLDWIKMFNTKELQILISGAQTPIDLNDLIKHTVYSNGYHRDHGVIKIFWEVIASFDETQKRKLLKFITSCSRPPLLGFKDLYPALCIQNAGKEPERLPTASTCMNLLKLPEVYDKEIMRDKLTYSINSSSGFELS